MERNLSNEGLALIKKFEGCRLKAYKVSAADPYYTIGYGHYSCDISKNDTITQEQAEELLKKDCDKFVKHVNLYMCKYNFNQNQFDALVSFAYNIGSITKLTLNGTRTIEIISSKIPEYCKSNGKVLKGLVARRAEEKALFDTPCTGKTLTDVAKEVIAGKWGNGEERIRKLENAGYNYAVVQAIVNELLK